MMDSEQMAEGLRIKPEIDDLAASELITEDFVFEVFCIIFLNLLQGEHLFTSLVTKQKGEPKLSQDGSSYYDPSQVNPSVCLLSPRAVPS